MPDSSDLAAYLASSLNTSSGNDMASAYNSLVNSGLYQGSADHYVNADQADQLAQQAPVIGANWDGKTFREAQNPLERLALEANRATEALAAGPLGFDANKGLEPGNLVAFAASLPGQMISAIPDTYSNAYEAITGTPVMQGYIDDDSGKYYIPDYQADAEQRAAAGLYGAINVGGMVAGATGRVGGTVAELLSKGAIGKNAAEGLMKRAFGNTAGQIAFDAAEEGGEEFVQTYLEEARDKDLGENTFEHALVGAGWGALGGGMMSGAVQGIRHIVGQDKPGEEPGETDSPGANEGGGGNTMTTGYDNDGWDELKAAGNIPPNDRANIPKPYQDFLKDEQSRASEVKGSTSARNVRGSGTMDPRDMIMGVQKLRSIVGMNIDGLHDVADMLGVREANDADTSQRVHEILDSPDAAARVNAILDEKFKANPNDPTLSIVLGRNPATKHGAFRVRLRAVDESNGLTVNSWVLTVVGADFDGDLSQIYLDPRQDKPELANVTRDAIDLIADGVRQEEGRADFDFSQINLSGAYGRMRDNLSHAFQNNAQVRSDLLAMFDNAVGETDKKRRYAMLTDLVSSIREAEGGSKDIAANFVTSVSGVFGDVLEARLNELASRVANANQTDIADVAAVENALKRYDGYLQTTGSLGTAVSVAQCIRLLCGDVFFKVAKKANPQYRQYNQLGYSEVKALYDIIVSEGYESPDSVFRSLVRIGYSVCAHDDSPVTSVVNLINNITRYRIENELGLFNGNLRTKEDLDLFEQKFIEIYNDCTNMSNEAKKILDENGWEFPDDAVMSRTIPTDAKMDSVEFVSAFKRIFGGYRIEDIFDIGEAVTLIGESFSSLCISYREKRSWCPAAELVNLDPRIRSLLNRLVIEDDMALARYGKKVRKVLNESIRSGGETFREIYETGKVTQRQLGVCTAWSETLANLIDPLIGFQSGLVDIQRWAGTKIGRYLFSDIEDQPVSTALSIIYRTKYDTLINNAFHREIDDNFTQADKEKAQNTLAEFAKDRYSIDYIIVSQLFSDTVNHRSAMYEEMLRYDAKLEDKMTAVMQFAGSDKLADSDAYIAKAFKLTFDEEFSTLPARLAKAETSAAAIIREEMADIKAEINDFSSAYFERSDRELAAAALNEAVDESVFEIDKELIGATVNQSFAFRGPGGEKGTNFPAAIALDSNFDEMYNGGPMSIVDYAFAAHFGSFDVSQINLHLVLRCFTDPKAKFAIHDYKNNTVGYLSREAILKDCLPEGSVIPTENEKGLTYDQWCVVLKRWPQLIGIVSGRKSSTVMRQGQPVTSSGRRKTLANLVSDYKNRQSALDSQEKIIAHAIEKYETQASNILIGVTDYIPNLIEEVCGDSDIDTAEFLRKPMRERNELLADAHERNVKAYVAMRMLEQDNGGFTDDITKMIDKSASALNERLKYLADMLETESRKLEVEKNVGAVSSIVSEMAKNSALRSLYRTVEKSTDTENIGLSNVYDNVSGSILMQGYLKDRAEALIRYTRDLLEIGGKTRRVREKSYQYLDASEVESFAAQRWNAVGSSTGLWNSLEECKAAYAAEFSRYKTTIDNLAQSESAVNAFVITPDTISTKAGVENLINQMALRFEDSGLDPSFVSELRETLGDTSDPNWVPIAKAEDRESVAENIRNNLYLHLFKLYNELLVEDRITNVNDKLCAFSEMRDQIRSEMREKIKLPINGMSKFYCKANNVNTLEELVKKAKVPKFNSIAAAMGALNAKGMISSSGNVNMVGINGQMTALSAGFGWLGEGDEHASSYGFQPRTSTLTDLRDLANTADEFDRSIFNSCNVVLGENRTMRMADYLALHEHDRDNGEQIQWYHLEDNVNGLIKEMQPCYVNDFAAGGSVNYIGALVQRLNSAGQEELALKLKKVFGEQKNISFEKEIRSLAFGKMFEQEGRRPFDGNICQELYDALKRTRKEHAKWLKRLLKDDGARYKMDFSDAQLLTISNFFVPAITLDVEYAGEHGTLNIMVNISANDLAHGNMEAVTNALRREVLDPDRKPPETSFNVGNVTIADASAYYGSVRESSDRMLRVATTIYHENGENADIRAVNRAARNAVTNWSNVRFGKLTTSAILSHLSPMARARRTSLPDIIERTPYQYIVDRYIDARAPKAKNYYNLQPRGDRKYLSRESTELKNVEAALNAQTPASLKFAFGTDSLEVDGLKVWKTFANLNEALEDKYNKSTDKHLRNSILSDNGEKYYPTGSENYIVLHESGDAEKALKYCVENDIPLLVDHTTYATKVMSAINNGGFPVSIRAHNEDLVKGKDLVEVYYDPKSHATNPLRFELSDELMGVDEIAVIHVETGAGNLLNPADACIVFGSKWRGLKRMFSEAKSYDASDFLTGSRQFVPNSYGLRKCTKEDLKKIEKAIAGDWQNPEAWKKAGVDFTKLKNDLNLKNDFELCDKLREGLSKVSNTVTDQDGKKKPQLRRAKGGEIFGWIAGGNPNVFAPVFLPATFPNEEVNVMQYTVDNGEVSFSASGEVNIFNLAEGAGYTKADIVNECFKGVATLLEGNPEVRKAFADYANVNEDNLSEAITRDEVLLQEFLQYVDSLLPASDADGFSDRFDGGKIKCDAVVSEASEASRQEGREELNLITNLFYGSKLRPMSLLFEKDTSDPGMWKVKDSVKNTFGSLQEVHRLLTDARAWESVANGSKVLGETPAEMLAIRNLAKICVDYYAGYNPINILNSFAFVDHYDENGHWDGKIFENKLGSRKFWNTQFSAILGMLGGDNTLRVFHAMDNDFCEDIDRGSASSTVSGRQPLFDKRGFMLLNTMAIDGQGNLLKTPKYEKVRVTPFAFINDSTIADNFYQRNATYSPQHLVTDGLEYGYKEPQIKEMMDYSDYILGNPQFGKYDFGEKLQRKVDKAFGSRPSEPFKAFVENLKSRPWVLPAQTKFLKGMAEIAENLMYPRQIRIDSETTISSDDLMSNDQWRQVVKEFRRVFGNLLTSNDIELLARFQDSATFNEGNGQVEVDINSLCNAVRKMTRNGEVYGKLIFHHGNYSDGRFTTCLIPKDLLHKLYLSIESTGDTGQFNGEEAYLNALKVEQKACEQRLASDTRIKKSQRRAVSMMYMAAHGWHGDNVPLGHILGDTWLEDLDEADQAIIRSLGATMNLSKDELGQIAEKQLENNRIMQDVARHNDSPSRTIEVEDPTVPLGSTTVARISDDEALQKGLSNVTDCSRMMSFLDLCMPLGNIMQRGAGVSGLNLALRLGRGPLGQLSPYFTRNAVNQDVLQQAINKATARKLWISMRIASFNGQINEFVQAAKSASNLDEWINKYQNDLKGFDKIKSIVYGFGTGGNVFTKAQMEAFVNSFEAICEKDEFLDSYWNKKITFDLPDGTHEDRSRLEEMLRGDNGFERFVLQCLDPDSSVSYIPFMQAMQTASEADMAQQTTATALLEDMLGRMPIGQFVFHTTVSKFPRYGLNFTGRVLNFFLPISTLNFRFNEILREHSNEGGRIQEMHLEQYQIHTLRQAMMIDAMKIGTGALALVLLGMTGAVQPPDDEEKWCNYDEWLICGMRISDAWWIQDILGIALPYAMFVRSAELGRPTFSILTKGVAQACYSNPMIRLSDAVGFWLDPTENFFSDFERDAIEFQDAEGGEPGWTEWLQTNTLSFGLSYVSQFITPAFVKNLYNSSLDYERSYKRVFDETVTGVTSEDGINGITSKTTYEDAMLRRLTRRNPVLGWIADMVIHPKTGYMAHEMPYTVYYDDYQLQSREQYKIDPSDSEEVKKRKSMELLALIQENGYQKLQSDGFSIDAYTKGVLSSYVWDIVNTLEYNWIQNYKGVDYKVLGNGDFNTGREIYNQAELVYKEQKQYYSNLYYQQIKPLSTTVQQYRRYNTTYEQDVNGNVYASGYHNSSLLPFMTAPGTLTNPEGTSGYENDFTTPSAVTGEPLKQRALVPYPMDYDEWPDLESWDDVADRLGITLGSPSTVNSSRAVSSMASNKNSEAASNGGNGGYGYGVRYGGGGGGGRRSSGGSGGSVYNRARIPNPVSPRTINDVRTYRTKLDYLRPGIETKGSREAYKRSDF